MPMDQVSVWIRGSVFMVRFPHSHTVQIPVDKPEALVRVLRARRVAAIRANGKPEDMPRAPSQEQISAWAKHNSVTNLPAGNALSGKLQHKDKQEIFNESYEEVWAALYK